MYFQNSVAKLRLFHYISHHTTQQYFKNTKKAAITAAFFRYRSLPLIPQGEKINHPVGKSSSPLGGGWEGALSNRHLASDLRSFLRFNLWKVYGKHAVLNLCGDLLLLYIVWQNQCLFELRVAEFATQVVCALVF